MIIAVDFDGTCVDHAFPNIGVAVDDVIWGLRELVEMGHQLVLWTCRENDLEPGGRQYLEEAEAWFDDRGITLAGLNERPDDGQDYRRKGLRRKLFADVYIDDAIIGGFPGWKTVVEEIRKMGN